MILCGRHLKTFWLSLSLLLLGIFSATPAAKAFTSSDIQYYYDFDNGGNSMDYYEIIGGGNSLSDYQANNRNIGTTTGKFGDAIVSTDNVGDGGSGSCVNGGGADQERTIGQLTSGNFSISAWVKTNESNSYGHILSSTSNTNYRLDLRNGTGLNWSYAKTGGGYCDQTYANINPNDNTWHNIIVMGTWGSLSTTFKIYVDGVDQGVTPPNCDQLPAPSGTAFLDFLGAEYCKYALKGAVDDVALFKKLLTTDEIDNIQTNSISGILNPTASCGDGSCNGTETFNTCPQDCLMPLLDDSLYFQNQYSSAPQCGLPIRYDTAYYPGITSDYVDFYECAEGDCGTKTWIASTTIINEYSVVVEGINQTGAYIPPPATSGNYVYEAISSNGGVYHFFIFWGYSCSGISYINDNLYDGGGYFNNGNATSSFSTSTAAFNLNAHDIACSEDEWNATSSFLGINGTKIRCEITAGAISIGQGFVNMVQSAVKGAINGISSLFPVNMVIKIKESWTESASSTLPASLSWLDDEVDSNGNITIGNVEPIEGAGIATTTIWGKDMGADFNEWETWRLRFRSLTTWFWAGLFIWYQIIQRGIRIKNSLG